MPQVIPLLISLLNLIIIATFVPLLISIHADVDSEDDDSGCSGTDEDGGDYGEGGGVRFGLQQTPCDEKTAASPGQGPQLGRARRRKKTDSDADESSKGCVRPHFVDGKPVLLDFCNGYAQRPVQAHALTLYEFRAAVVIEPKKPPASETKNSCGEVGQQEGADDACILGSTGGPQRARKSNAGRKPNDTLQFASDSEYSATHQIRRLSKMKVPKMYPNPPRHPRRSFSLALTAAARRKWEQSAHTFAQYALVLHRPWYIKRDEGGESTVYFFDLSDNSSVEAVFTWAELERYMLHLSQPPSATEVRTLIFF